MAADTTNRLLSVMVQATREGGAVERFHAMPHTRTYSVASHSYGAVSLLLLLHPAPSIALVKALQWHDVAERWLGDVPATAKWGNVPLAEVYDRTEQEHLEALGLAQALTLQERHWLKSLDTLELWLWCREEMCLHGNAAVLECLENCEASLDKYRNASVCPDEVWAFYRRVGEQVPDRRLPDVFDKVRTQLATIRGHRAAEG
jgi:5'-deoxynucleotidase YfbR-like HD superfamily hydrolase